MKIRNECTVLEKLRASTFLFATAILITLVMMKISLNVEAPYHQPQEMPLVFEILWATIGTIFGVNIVFSTVVSGILMVKAVFELIMIRLDIGDW